VGEHIVEVIIAQRKAGGPFQSAEDFLTRIADKDLNKKSLESLIKSGAFDQFGERGKLLANLENLLGFHRQLAKNGDSTQASLFAAAALAKPKLNLSPAVAISNAEKLSWEKDLLGLYVSEHPFSDFKKPLGGYNLPLGRLPEVNSNEEAVVAGIITSIKKILTKKNETMLFVKIEDGADNVEILVFPSLLKETAAVWQEGAVIICQGTVSDKDGEVKILANKAAVLTLDKLTEELARFKAAARANGRGRFGNGYHNGQNNGYKYQAKTEIKPPPAPPLKLIIEQAKMTPETIEELKNLCLAHQGVSKVYIKIITATGHKVVEASALVDISGDLIKLIKKELGEVVKIV